MVKLRTKLILLAISILSILAIYLLTLFFFGVELKILGVSGYVIVILTTIFLLISAFLPSRLSKLLREISYFCMFIMIILIEISIVSIYAKPISKFNIEDCKVGGIFPSKENLKEGTFTYDALAYTSCILTGKFPSEQSEIGWVTFYIFYLILPFAFIFILIYAIISGIGLESWFNIDKNIKRVLSFIIAMYATRTMMGSFILQFAGYGAWGLGAVFIAILLVAGLRKMMEGWYGIEGIGEETRRVIETEMEFEREYSLTVRPILEDAERLARNGQLTAAIDSLNDLTNIPLWRRISQRARDMIDWQLRRASAASAAGNANEFIQIITQIRKIIENFGRRRR